MPSDICSEVITSAVYIWVVVRDHYFVGDMVWSCKFWGCMLCVLHLQTPAFLLWGSSYVEDLRVGLMRDFLLDFSGDEFFYVFEIYCNACCINLSQMLLLLTTSILKLKVLLLLICKFSRTLKYFNLLFFEVLPSYWNNIYYLVLQYAFKRQFILCIRGIGHSLRHGKLT